MIQEELAKELNELEEDVLNERLAGADHVPVHVPPNASKAPEGNPLSCFSSSVLECSLCFLPPSPARQPIAEDDEEAQLRELQAQLAL